MDWDKLISTVGFPIAVTVYVLWRVEDALKALSNKIHRLTVVLAAKGVLDDDDTGR